MSKNKKIKYLIQTTKKFDKNLRLIKKRGYNLKLLEEVVDLLSEGKKLPVKYKDHQLKGEFLGSRECHITPDWLLIYKINENMLILFLMHTGTHSDLFE